MKRRLTSLTLALFFIWSNCYSQGVFQEITTVLPNLYSGNAVWGDYDNDGDLDILISGSDQTYTGVSRVYQNNGSGVFNYQTQISLAGISNGNSEWVDYDNDGYLDIHINGNSGQTKVSKVYRNNGNNTFTEKTSILLPGVSSGNISWGDYNNDGDPDVLITGRDANYNNIYRLYRNNGNDTFTEQTGISLAPVSYGFAIWGDYNNDGNLDILLTGQPASKLYRNNGDNSFAEETGIELPGIYSGSAAWCDYDNDGDLDLLLTGSTSTENISQIFKNNGVSGFSKPANSVLTGVYSGSADWGDYDNDGDPDIIITGKDNNYNPVSIIYRNDGNDTFSNQTGIIIKEVSSSTVAWGDYDKDGDLDILLTGYDAITHGPTTRLYRNNGTIFNTQPVAPGNLSQSISGNSVSFSWNRATDSKTPQMGLSYNIYVSTSPSGSNIKAPDALIPSGLRKIARSGDILVNQYTFRNLKAGNYYWSVQAIDAAFAGSEFATEESFTVSFSNSISPIGDQYIAPGKTGNIITVSESEITDSRQWMYSIFPGGPYDKVLTGETSTTYAPKIIGDSVMYVVCISTKNGISVYSNEVKIELFSLDEQTTISLPGISHGSMAWGDYDNDEDLDLLICGIDVNSQRVSKVFRNDGSNSFTELTGISVPGLYYSSSDWIDYDNDGDLDILISGRDVNNIAISKIYNNNGNNSFTEQTSIVLTGLYYSSSSWGDYDNDGDQDLLITGRDQSSVKATKIYRNNGNKSFTEQIGISITAVDMGDCIWTDYDIDGDLDIIITGYNSVSGSVSKVFMNNGNNTFTEQTTIVLTGAYYSSIDIGDYDNDEYPDILLTGYNSSTGQRISKVYKNVAGTSFTEQTGIALTGINLGSAKWGDYDNDGDLDILLAGLSTSSGAVSEIYRNEGNNSFTRQVSNSFPGVYYNALGWADYDNDNDLDILLSGYTGTTRITKIYQNICKVANTPPGAPGNLSISMNGTDVTFNWELPNGDETLYNGISSNIRIGTSPGSSDIKTADANSESGFRYLTGHGNVGHTLSWTIKGLLPGSYYWSVQAIDHGYLASQFAEEKAFETYFTEATFTYEGYSIPYLGDYDRDGDIDILARNNTGSTFFRNDLSVGSGFTDINAGIPYSISGDYPGALGDYDKDGDVDIALSARDITLGFITVIYRNDNGTFININANIQGIWMGKMDWGDYDNDGDLDLFLYGNHEQSDDGEPLGLLYRNDGNDQFTNTEIYIEDARRGALALADYDKDGFLDILICGYNLSANIFTSVLKNNNGLSFTNINAGIQGYSYGDLDWGDYDNDGYLDIFITGGLYGGEGSTRIFHNNGDGSFSDIGINFPGDYSYYTTSEWGDYDNDGDLDILSSSDECIIRNDGNNIFAVISIGVSLGSGRWGDIDNDGDLDIVTGSSIYINNIITSNNAPDIPSNLNSAVSGSQALLSWDVSNDDITPSNGITYNVCVGTSAGNWDILSPMTATDPKYSKAIPGMGNTFTNTFKIIKDLPVGTYYWTVQSVDNGFMSSGFAPVKSFEIFPMFTNSYSSSWSDNSITVLWGDYNNDGALDFLYSHYSTIYLYRNDGNDLFTQIDPGISGDNDNLKWGDYDNDGDLDIISTDSIFRNDPGNVFTNTGVFFEYINFSFKTGDYDADGDLDILSDNKYIYRNDRNNTFTPINLGLTNEATETFDWFDYDNDGDLDIIITSGPYLDKTTEIFRNDGNDSFTPIQANMIGMDWSSISFADFDNDNDLDVYIGGTDSDYNHRTIIYRNNGNDTFTDINASIRGYQDPYSFWGDFDNDGYKDLILSGWNNGRTRNKLYQNNHNDTFEELDIKNIIEYIKIFDCADYDNDGDVDALTTSGVFRNNTNHSFDIPPVLTNLNTDFLGLDRRLFWDRAGNIKEPGYSYNIKIGTTPGGTEIKSPVSAPGLGNVPTDTSWVIRNLSPGLYYWSVQAINLNHKAGPWAPVKSFLMTKVSPDFSANTVCFGSNTVFTDLSVTSDVIIKWKWNFGDGDISYQRNPVHLYKTAGTFDVSLWAYSQSGDSAERVRQVVVRQIPVTSFTNNTVCAGTQTTFVNSTNINGLTISEWHWDFGDESGSNVQNPGTHGYLIPGTYKTILVAVADNGCSDTTSHLVDIGEIPTAAITSSGSPKFCSGDSIQLTNSFVDTYIYSWQIDGIDITGATQNSYIVNRKGSYSVKIINPIGNCTSVSAPINVIVDEKPSQPVISITGSDHFCEGESATLSVDHNPDLTYMWKLNTGSVGLDSNILVVRNSGMYNLIVKNSKECSVSSYNSFDIVVDSLPDVSAVTPSGATEFCIGGSVTLSVTPNASYKYSWSNETGTIPDAKTNSYLATSSGKFQLDITNDNECVLKTTPVSVTVKPMPVTPVIATENYQTGQCPYDYKVKLSTWEGTGYKYQWLRNGTVYPNGTLSYIQDNLPLSEYLPQGDYSVETDLDGCKIESEIININYAIAPEKPEILVKGPVVWYMATSRNTYKNYRWYLNDELISGANKYIYVANKKMGTYRVEVANENLCYISSDKKTIPTAKSDMTDFNIPAEYLVGGENDVFGKLKIYPNPTPGRFTIEMDNNVMGELDISIITQSGKEILNIKFDKTTEHFSSQIDLSGQPNGMYIINLLIDRYFATRKLLVE